MTERETERDDAPKPAGNASRGGAERRQRPAGALAALLRGGPVGLVVLAIALAAAVLLVTAELSTLREVDVVTATCEDLADASTRDDCERKGGEEHNYALVVIALFVLLMAWGAGPGRSAPAAVALVVAGLVVLGIAVIGDLPDIGKEGALGDTFEQAEAKAGPALMLEIIGGVLAAAAGAVRLALLRR